VRNANRQYMNAFAITPHDTNALAITAEAIYVGGAGAVKVTTAGGSTVVFSAVPAGSVIPLKCNLVFAAGTDATALVGLY